MGKKRNSTTDDQALFRQEIGDVRPLRDSGRAAPERPKPRPQPVQRVLDERRVMEELLQFPEDPAEMETGEELSYLRPGLQHRYLVRLKRGHYSIGDSIDLHQMNTETARAAIQEFLEQAHERGLGCVRIVHGKGLRSRNGPVLKRLAQRLLSRHPRVAAFASCRPVDGGTGAVAVLLRGGRHVQRG
jgi:DNA-nicking Smr family endonuclease